VNERTSCPRCGGTLNLRPSPLNPRLLSCRWCAFEFWRQQLEHDARRVIAEAERITQEAAA
jgi:hypothetical protein